jgi:hypothetical protein
MTLELPGALDLRQEALEALARGEEIEVVRNKLPTGVTVETLIIHAPGGASGDIGRAGQACGGDASWGDWDPATRTITLDGSDGEGTTVEVNLYGLRVGSGDGGGPPYDAATATGMYDRDF